jgi:hypothetical protein
MAAMPVFFAMVRQVKDLQLNVSQKTFFLIILNFQSGSGKTHTYIGPKDCLTSSNKVNISRKTDFGIVVQAADELFLAKHALRKRGISLNIGLQFIEVYDEKVTIFDLFTINLHHIQFS